MAPAAESCDYRLHTGLSDLELPTEACERPAWGDHDRCVWHANVDGKTTELLESEDPAPEELIDGAYLKEASLVGVDWFAGRSLVYADLTEAKVNAADFSDANLKLATLRNARAMSADFSGANLEGATFADGDLRRATLEDARLNEAVFTDVHISEQTAFGEATVYERESSLPELSDGGRLKATAWTYRQLHRLYRDNALPGLARRSYYQEKDARRRLAWNRGRYTEAVKWELSRWVMRYGSSPVRVLAVSFVVILAFALLFPLTGGIQEIQDGQAITYTLENPEGAPAWWLGRIFFKSLYFSVVTFATLGYGDIQPIGTFARLLAGLESMIGALLAALLVFVLARIVTW